MSTRRFLRLLPVRRSIRPTWRVGATLVLGVASAALGWVGCSSSDETAASPPQTTTPHADSGPAADATVPPTGANDAGDAAPLPTPACTPTLTGTPTWHPPTGYPKAACSDAQIAKFFADCVGGAAFDKAKCDADKAAFPACVACIDTDDTATAPGPIIHSGAFLNVNYPGCLAIEEKDASATGCAGTEGALLDCKMLACTTSCTALDAGAAKPYDDCAKYAAAAGPCTAENAAVSCSSNDPAAPICYSQTGEAFAVYAARVAAVFCGGLDGGAPVDGGPTEAGSSDGSADGASDAPADAPDAG